MSDYKFSAAQRFAVFKVFDGVCQWCRQPLDYLGFQVDHVLPESLLKDPARLSTVIKSYNLPSDFNINDFENWAPLHPPCNAAKNKLAEEDLGAVKTILDKCATRKERAFRIYLKIKMDAQSGQFLSTIQHAMEQNFLNMQKLQSILLKEAVMGEGNDDFKKIKEELEANIHYQADQLVGSIMQIYRETTSKVVSSIIDDLGKDWGVGVNIARISGESQHLLKSYIINHVNGKYTTWIKAAPEVTNGKFIVKFSSDNNDLEIKEWDIQEGINWEEYDETLRKHYKGEITRKIRQS